MRLHSILKENNVGIQTIKKLFDFLQIKTEPNINLKITDLEYKYLSNSLESECFKQYLASLKEIEKLKNKNIYDSLMKVVYKKPLTRFEIRLFLIFILKIHRLELINKKILKNNQKIEEIINENKYEEIAEWFRLYKLRKKVEELKPEDENEDEFEQDIYSEIIEYEKRANKYSDDYDDEEAIMKSFRSGDPEKFGF